MTREVCMPVKRKLVEHLLQTMMGKIEEPISLH